MRRESAVNCTEMCKTRQASISKHAAQLAQQRAGSGMRQFRRRGPPLLPPPTNPQPHMALRHASRVSQLHPRCILVQLDWAGSPLEVGVGAASAPETGGALCRPGGRELGAS